MFRLLTEVYLTNAVFFCVFCQNVENQEREEQNSGRAIKLVKGKVGKPKAKKLALEETLPSPFGRRVDPPAQPVKSDASKKLTKKKKVLGSVVKLQRGDKGFFFFFFVTVCHFFLG